MRAISGCACEQYRCGVRRKLAKVHKTYKLKMRIKFQEEYMNLNLMETEGCGAPKNDWWIRQRGAAKSKKAYGFKRREMEVLLHPRHKT
jgi:hypothetical protein